MVFEYFKALSEIPRGSGNTKAVSDYCVNFAKERGLFCLQDEADNVIIKKPASKGYENAPAVMLQGHLDMVCEKEIGSSHDFRKDPIRLITEGDYIRADKTTLGGDDGIAVAYALAILDSHEIAHPPLECVFTSDEEIGMVGASRLDMSCLKAKYLLNLDSEEEGIFLAGCAGGIRYDIKLPLAFEETKGVLARVSLSGLTGGHSGADIHKGRANADMLMGRILAALFGSFPDIRLVSMEGGSQDNAIPRSAEMKLMVPEKNAERLETEIEKLQKDFQTEYHVTDPELSLTVVFINDKRECYGETVSFEDMKRVSCFLANLPEGVQKMSQDLPSLTETSLNLGILSVEKEKGLTAALLIRSSLESGKAALCRRLEIYTEYFKGMFHTSGDYPAWEFNADSRLIDLIFHVYEEQYGKRPQIETIHAGVECGLFSAGIPGIEAVSLGPEILDIHTPKERISISSVNRVWNFLIEVLKRMKDA